MSTAELIRVPRDENGLERSSVEMGILKAETAATLVQGATEMAKQLAGVIEQCRLYNHIQGRRFVRVEGWTTLAAMMGVTAREVGIAEQEDGSFEATVELVRHKDGQVISRASALCGADEPTWAGRPKYARRSMASTRATGKACRLAFSWVMSLAGYEATPAEEMDSVEAEVRPAAVSESPQPAQPSVMRPTTGERVITDKQRKRMYAIAKQNGWTDEGFRTFLRNHGYDSSADVRIDDYDDLCGELSVSEDGLAGADRPESFW